MTYTYTLGAASEGSQMTIERKPVSTVAIVSGGMDSITLLHLLAGGEDDVHVLSFDYGQRHKKELEFARYHADQFDFQHDIIDLSGITHLISNSALTSGFHSPVAHTIDPSNYATYSVGEIEVPDGHYAEESMKLTVVPNRNMMMLSIAAAVAVNEKADRVAIGVHAGDHFVYPDCRPDFINAANLAIALGNEGFGTIPTDLGKRDYIGDVKVPKDLPEFVYAPFITKTKTDIANIGNVNDVDWTKTWSCYKGGDKHCGTCGTCTERKEALRDADAGWDPTEYEN